MHEDSSIPDEEMILLLFSEWLDADMHLLVNPEGDEMTHHDLVTLYREMTKAEGWTQYRVKAIS